MGTNGRIAAVCLSDGKGTRKKEVEEGYLVPDWGLKDDAHAGSRNRQVSLLAIESVEKMKAKGLKLKPGDFAENITTEGIELATLPVGTRLRIGDEIFLEISQIGKECHTRCAIYYQAGDCIMPREGVFAKVIKGGKVTRGDSIVILKGEPDKSG